MVDPENFDTFLFLKCKSAKKNGELHQNHQNQNQINQSYDKKKKKSAKSNIEEFKMHASCKFYRHAACILFEGCSRN